VLPTLHPHNFIICSPLIILMCRNTSCATFSVNVVNSRVTAHLFMICTHIRVAVHDGYTWAEYVVQQMHRCCNFVLITWAHDDAAYRLSML
jgi:hypothetical protein